MALDPEVEARVREALADAPQVQDDRIDVHVEGASLVLRGAVATAEQAGVAAMVAARHAPEVHNQLHVDEHLREDASGGETVGEPRERTRPPRSDELTVQASTFGPTATGEDLQREADRALAENTPLDPPEAPHDAPTAGEQHGFVDRDVRDEPPAEPDEEGEGRPSLADMSREELERSTRRADASGPPARDDRSGH